jgi:glucose/arabinose dehydrogenase
VSLLLGLALLGLGCDHLQWQALKVYLAANPYLEDGPQAYAAQSEALTLQPVVEGLEFPWDMTFLSAREALVTEKPGRLSRVNLETGARQLISGVPEVKFRGQGGLHGVELHPNFERNGLLYLAYAIPVGEKGTTRLARARLDENELKDLEVLFTAEPAGSRSIHYGGALEFGADGKLYLSVGERGQREFAQNLAVDLGKIHRFEPDGGVPSDNPFVDQPAARPSIFSYGHRNPQGLVRHPETGEIWSVEHGPQGGDEVNIARAGRNYGWPLITYGEEYGGGKIGETHAEGLEQPIHYWVPSIATGGMAFYTGDDLRSWKGNLFVAGLRKTLLARVALDGERVTEVESLFADLWLRIRGVAQSPDLRLYVISENGKIFRIERAAPGT